MLRLLATFALALTLTTADAHAKKGDAKKKEGIELTGIAAFDDIFTQVADIDARLVAAEDLLKTGKKDLIDALALKKGTPLKTGLAELGERADGKLAVVLDGKQPKLQATDAIPTDVQEALDAVNRLTGGIVGSVEELAEIPAEAQKLAKKTQTFPSKLKDEISADPLTTLLKAPKLTKTLKSNAEITAGLPSRSTNVVGRMNDMVTVVRAEFPLHDDKSPGGEPGAAEPPATPRGRR